QGFLGASGVFEGLSAEGAAEKQVRVKLERVLDAAGGFIEFAAAEADDDFSRGPHRPKRVDATGAIDYVERFVEPVHRDVDDGETDTRVGGFRLSAQGFEERRLRLGQPALVDV